MMSAFIKLSVKATLFSVRGSITKAVKVTQSKVTRELSPSLHEGGYMERLW